MRFEWCLLIFLCAEFCQQVSGPSVRQLPVWLADHRSQDLLCNHSGLSNFKYKEETTKKNQGESKTSLASSPQRQEAAFTVATYSFEGQAKESPQQGPDLYCQNPQRDGKTTAMEMRTMPTTDQRNLGMVSKMWTTLAELCRCYLCTFGSAVVIIALAIYGTMDGFQLLVSRMGAMAQISKPKKEKKPKEGQLWPYFQQRRQRRPWTTVSLGIMATFIASMECWKWKFVTSTARPWIYSSDEGCRRTYETETIGQGIEIARRTVASGDPVCSIIVGSDGLAERRYERIQTARLPAWTMSQGNRTAGPGMEKLHRQLEQIHTTDDPELGEPPQTVRGERKEVPSPEAGGNGANGDYAIESVRGTQACCGRCGDQRGECRDGASTGLAAPKRSRTSSKSEKTPRDHGDYDWPDEADTRGIFPKTTQEGRGDRLGEKTGFRIGHTVWVPKGGQRWRTDSHKVVRWEDGWLADFDAPCHTPPNHDFVGSWLSWTHSVVQEDDYKSPWMAEQQGLLLQADVQGLVTCTFDDRTQAFAVMNLSDEIINPRVDMTQSSPLKTPLRRSLTMNSELFEVHNMYQTVDRCRKCRFDEMDIVEPEIEQFEWDPLLPPPFLDRPQRPTMDIRIGERATTSFLALDLDWNTQMAIITYGLHGHCRGRRDAVLHDHTIEGLKFAVQEIWDDFALYDAEIIHVEQRPEQHHYPTFIVVFEPQILPFDRAVPVLQQIIWEDYQEKPQRTQIRSIFHQQAAHMYQICGMAGVIDQCVQRQCTILVGFSPVTAHVLADFTKGDLVMIFIPPVLIPLPIGNIHNMQQLQWPLDYTRDRYPMMPIEIELYIVNDRRQFTLCYSSTPQRVADRETLRSDIQAMLPGRNYGDVQVYLVHAQTIEDHTEYRFMMYFIVTMNSVPNTHVPVIGRDQTSAPPSNWRVAFLPWTTTRNEILQAFGWTPEEGLQISSPNFILPEAEPFDLQSPTWFVYQRGTTVPNDPWYLPAPVEEDEEHANLLQTKVQLKSDPVPCHQFELLIQQLREEDFEMIWRPPPLPQLQQTLAATSLLWEWDQSWTDLHYHVYTDGSADAGRTESSWAFAVIIEGTTCQGERQFAFGGVAGGRHQVQPDHDAYVRGSRHQPIEAEASALIWAFLWTIHQGILGKITYHSDALATLQGTVGLWKLPTHAEDESIFSIARYLYLIVKRQAREIQALHVPAHVGVPGNEMADEIAKAMRTGLIFPTEVPLTGKTLAGTPSLKYAWIQGKINAEFPEITGEQMSLGPTPTTENLTPLLDYFQEECSKSEWVQCNLRMATINALTLHKPDDIAPFDKRKHFELQAHEKQFNIIGLQETRVKTSRLITTENFYMLQSAAEHGHGGLELWIAKRFGAMHVKPGDFKIFAQTFRMLGVCIRTSFLTMDVIVIHAPPDRHSPKTIAFWNELNELIARRQGAGHPLCVLGDCNAHIDECEPHVGSLHAETQCANGHRLLALLQERDLMLPSTFATVHQGHHILA